MQNVVERVREFWTEELAAILIPIAILVVGFVIALLFAALVRRGFKRTRIDERLVSRLVGPEHRGSISTERWAGRIVFYTVLAITAMAFLQAIELTAATEPLSVMLSSLLGFVPNLIGAVAIAFVAWVVATAVRRVLVGALARWDIDRLVAEPDDAVTAPDEQAAEAASGAPRAPAERQPMTVQRAISEAGYWLVWLMFIPALLGVLELGGLLAPIATMLDQALGFVPNIVSAAVIILAGWLTGRIVQRLVSNVLAGVGTDRLSERVGLSRAFGASKLSSLVGLIVFVVILVPVSIAALNALRLDAITAPASQMLERFFIAIPAIFGSAILIGVAYIAARLLATVIGNLLDGIGFDRILSKIGFTQQQLGERTPSQLVAGLAMVAVIYFAATEAASLLGFATFAALAAEFAVLAGHILLGLVIFGFGLYLSKLAADTIERSSVGQARVLALATRTAVLTLAGAMSLRQMGLADQIIELGFGLVVGAVAVAAALAFGLGGRDAASKTIEEVREHLGNARKVAGFGGGGSAGTEAASITSEQEPPSP